MAQNPTATHEPPHADAGGTRNTLRSRRGGFTLIELMAVMVIIALVAAITLASAKYLIRTARQRRKEVTKLTLTTALARYRHEYNIWPIPVANPSGSSYSVSGEDNKNVFGMLRENNDTANPKGIRFLDETTLYTSVRSGTTDQLVILSTARSPDFQNGALANRDLPLVYREPKSGDTRYFRVTFNFDDDTVKVDD